MQYRIEELYITNTEGDECLFEVEYSEIVKEHGELQLYCYGDIDIYREDRLEPLTLKNNDPDYDGVVSLISSYLDWDEIEELYEEDARYYD